MHKFNNVLVVITVVVLVLGLFYTPILGLLFLMTALMWIVGFSNFTENFQKDRSRAIAILLIKTGYLAVNATINYIPPKSVVGFVLLLLMIFVLTCEMIFCRMLPKAYRAKQDSNEAQQCAKESQTVIELRYASYLLGNKNMLFGDDQTARAIRGLAISAVTFVATLVSAVATLLIGRFLPLMDRVYIF